MNLDTLPNEYVVFDIETTGFSPKFAEIIEIGALKCNGSKIIDEFQTYIHPIEDYIPPRITMLTGISLDMVKNAPPFDEALVNFFNFVGKNAVVGHNVKFDIGFVSHYARACMLDFEPEYYDTLPLSRKSLKLLSDHKLETIKNYFGIDLPSHNALDDCRVTQYLFEYCKKY